MNLWGTKSLFAVAVLIVYFSTVQAAPKSAGSNDRPNPDPTSLTTDALLREITILKEFITLQGKGIRSLMNEKFARADQQFDLIEKQRVEQKNDTKAAVDAALTAQRESAKGQSDAFATATAKSEAAVSKQIDALTEAYSAANESSRLAREEVKERLAEEARILRAAIVEVDRKASAIESEKVGASFDRSGLYSGIAALGVLFGIGGVVVALSKSRAAGPHA